MIRILVNGALGKMGGEVCKKILAEDDLELAAVVDIKDGLVPTETGHMKVDPDLVAAIDREQPDVVVDFTRPDTVMNTLRTVLKKKIFAVVGTTGFSAEDLQELDSLSRENDTAVLVAPNFALGAVVMIKLACEAAKYFSDVEIIEKHHDRKLDAPSGTALITAQKIAEVRRKMSQGHPEERETLPGVRGGDYEGMRIHSVRLPGYVASQEVVFGGQGETLRVSTEPVSRECFMPGVALGCRKILGMRGLVYGLDKLL